MKLWDIGPTLFHEVLVVFAVLAVRTCRTYLPYLTVRACRTWPYDLRSARSHAKYGSCRSRDLRLVYIKPRRAQRSLSPSVLQFIIILMRYRDKNYICYYD